MSLTEWRKTMNLLVDSAEKFAEGNEFLKFTIIKELLHYDILDALNQSEITQEIVFQGGTSLRLCYNAIRYSEDLDFALTKKNIFSKDLMKEFDEIFVQTIRRKYGLEAEIEYPKEKTTDRSVTVEKWTARIFLKHKAEKQPKIKIEVANVPSHDYSIGLIKNRYYNNAADIPILVESREEILADKIIALAARGFFKARDYWDIYYLNNFNIKPNKDLVEKKIEDYQITNFKERLEEITNSLFEKNYEPYSQLFRTEISRFLNNNDYKYAQKQDFIDSVFKAVQRVAASYNEQTETKVRKHR
jgi:predicted nucleotidyltransferase component of viral defense system